MKVVRLFIAILLTVVASPCSPQDTRPTSHYLEGVLSRFARSPHFPRPEDFANALHVSISRPTLKTYTSPADSGTLTYQVGSNRWGITGINLYFQADKSGLRAAKLNLGLSLNTTYCLKPGNFPAKLGLKIDRMMVPISDGPGAFEMDRYWSPVVHNTMLQIDSSSEQECAKNATLFKFYDSHEAGPLLTTVIPKELANRYAHPPFTAIEFWHELMALIRMHNGYIAPTELEQTFDLKLASDAIPSSVRTELGAQKDWYFSLFYEVTGPGFRTFQPGLMPNGQGSMMTIEIPSLSFVNKSGEFECLAMSPVETDLLHAGWTIGNRAGFKNFFILAGHDANISIMTGDEGDHECVTSIRIAGALDQNKHAQ